MTHICCCCYWRRRRWKSEINERERSKCYYTCRKTRTSLLPARTRKSKKGKRLHHHEIAVSDGGSRSICLCSEGGVPWHPSCLYIDRASCTSICQLASHCHNNIIRRCTCISTITCVCTQQAPIPTLRRTRSRPQQQEEETISPPSSKLHISLVP